MHISYTNAYINETSPKNRNNFSNLNLLSSGVEVRFKNQVYPVLVNVSNVKELLSFETESDGRGVRVGAALTLSDLKENLEKVIESMPSKFMIKTHYRWHIIIAD